MKSLSFVCQSVCLFVCPSGTKFSRDWIISFFWYFTCWHVDIWSWYLVTNKARFLKKKRRGEFGFNGPKSGPKRDFSPFAWVWIICFPWNCIQWYFASISNIYKKNLLVQIWGKRAKFGPEINFYCHFLKFGSLVFL